MLTVFHAFGDCLSVKCAALVNIHRTGLTSKVLSCSCQQAVENVESPLIFCLSNGPGLLQKI